MTAPREHDETTSPDLGHTVDGVKIVDGLVVWTNEMRPGTVRLDQWSQWNPDWFDVEYPGVDGQPGRRVMQNAERVATRFEGRAAQAALRNELATVEPESGDSVS